MSTFAMVLDDVLRKTKDESVNLQGMHLYNALASVGRLAILCGPDEEKASWFLASNGFTQHAALIPEKPASAPTKEGRRLYQVTELRAQQARLEFVVEPDPDIATALFREGIPVLVYLHPQYTQPAFRPDYRSVAKPWDNLIDEVDYQIKMRAEEAAKEWEQL